MKNKYWIYVIGLLIVSCVIVYSCMGKTLIKEILVLLIALAGAVAVFLQTSKNTLLTTGDFILNLQQVYSGNEKFTELFMKCWEDYCSDSYELKLDEDRNTLINYLTFFESIYIMLDNGALNIELLDELFGRRFFVVVNNKTVQKFELIYEEDGTCRYYSNICKLYKKWKKYRLRQEKHIQKKNPGYIDKLIHTSNSRYEDLEDAMLNKQCEMSGKGRCNITTCKFRCTNN